MTFLQPNFITKLKLDQSVKPELSPVSQVNTCSSLFDLRNLTYVMLPNEYSVQCFLKNRCKYRAMFLLEGESRQNLLVPKFSLKMKNLSTT